jgi:hypothetical protein
MNCQEKIDLYRRFDEGTELSDAVSSLLDAAFTLDGLSAEHECQLTILTVEKLIRDYMYQAQSAELFWHDYEKIDEELYCRMLGVERKMTQMEYMSLSNPCPYCEGNCPNDPEHMCDEFSSQTQE